MVQPLRVHAVDKTEAEVRARHAEIEATLAQMGPQQVQMLLLTGGIPTEWNPIVHAWLKGDKLDPEEGGGSAVA